VQVIGDIWDGKLAEISYSGTNVFLSDTLLKHLINPNHNWSTEVSNT